MFGVMISSLGIVQDRISRSRLAGEPPDVHITPRLGTIGLFEFDRADEIIAEGEAAVERVLPDLRSKERRVGKECGRTGRCRGTRHHYTKKRKYRRRASTG